MSDHVGISGKGCLSTTIIAAIITVIGTGIFEIATVVVEHEQETSSFLTREAIQPRNTAPYLSLKSTEIEVSATPEATIHAPTPVPTATSTPIMIPTTISAVAVCSGSPPTQLMGQRQAQVVPGTGVGNIRAGIESGTSLKVIPEGGIVEILEGPVCGPSHFRQTWYRVRSGTAIGWMSEGNTIEYWLQPPR